MADQVQLAIAASEATKRTVKEDWQRNQVWIDKDCFLQCWHKIWRWVDVDSLTGQLMKHGFLNDDEDFYWIDPHKHWSPKQRADNLLNTLAPKVGSYGHYLLYMCIRDCDANPLGHGDAVKELVAYSREARLRPPDSLTSNGGPTHPSSRSQGNNPRLVSGRRNTDGPPSVAGSQLLAFQGLRVSGQGSIQPGSQPCSVPVQETHNSWTSGSDVERDSPAGQGGQMGPSSHGSGATGEGGQMGPPSHGSGATGQGGQTGPSHGSGATGQGGQTGPSHGSGATGSPSRSSDATAAQQSPTTSGSPSGEVGSIPGIVKQLAKQGKFRDISEKFEGEVVHFALPEACLSEHDFLTSLFKFIVACLNSRKEFPLGIFIAGVDFESNEQSVELSFDHVFFTPHYLSERLKRAVFVRASDDISVLRDDDTSLVKLEFITVTPPATSTSSNTGFVIAMATVMPDSRVCADKIYTYRQPKDKGKGAVLTRVEDGILELRTAASIRKLEDSLNVYCRRQNNE